MASRYRACLPNNLTGRRRPTLSSPISPLASASSADSSKALLGSIQPATQHVVRHQHSSSWSSTFVSPSRRLADVPPSSVPPASSSLSKRQRHPALAPSSLRTPRPQHKPQPIPNSYWATPYLVACEFPYCPYDAPITPAMVSQQRDQKLYVGRQKIDDLLQAGVRTFIDLTEPRELFPYYPHLSSRCTSLGVDVRTVEYHNFPIRDRSLPESIEHVRQILQVLRDNERKQRITAVHCRGGIGRTGLIVGCWLVESGVAVDGNEALRRIAEHWKLVEKCKRFPNSPETGPQFEFVRNFTRMVTYSS